MLAESLVLAIGGALLGLAIAAKFYPLLFLGPLVLLCVRAGRWRAMGRMLTGTAAGWLARSRPNMESFIEGPSRAGAEWAGRRPSAPDGRPPRLRRLTR
jgi:hypothetical protein